MISRRALVSGAILMLALVLFAVGAAAQTPDPVTSIGLTSTYAQNFDSLASSATSSVLPAGWAFNETGTNANATYNTGTGSSNSGDTYSFGATGSSDRAFGGLRSGSLIPTIGASFTNATGASISSLDVAYTGEQWRVGTANRADTMSFQYSLDATSLTTGTWTSVTALDYTDAPGTAVAAANGLPTPVTGSVSGLSIPNGSTFWIRWNDVDASGADDGMGIDDSP